MESSNYHTIAKYLSSGIYPDGFTKQEKRLLRQKAGQFKVKEDGLLYYNNKCTPFELMYGVKARLPLENDMAAEMQSSNDVT